VPSRSDDDDPQLFRDAVRGARELATGKRAPQRRKPPARATFARADRASVLIESLDVRDPEGGTDSGEALQFRRDGVQDAVLRRLRRGAYRIDAEIDLHGLTAAEAKTALSEFLVESLSRDRRCVRIVHGKGLRSGNRGPVLKHTVNNFLRRIAAVVAFASAREVDGGTGAVLVLLASGASRTAP
jgi:DNA-nicking Smr family endonuclease